MTTKIQRKGNAPLLTQKGDKRVVIKPKKGENIKAHNMSASPSRPFITLGFVKYIAEKHNINLSQEYGLFVKKHLTEKEDAMFSVIIDATAIACEVFRVTPHSLQSHRRGREIVTIRQILYKYLYEECGICYRIIGRFFGNRDHSTVVWGRDRANEFIEMNDFHFLSYWNQIKDMLYGAK
jgi:chromosomal replication initiation ATPase DnaA